MTTIEDKRKELEKGYNEIKDLDKHQNKHVRLYYFNLGVELAQKDVIKDMVFIMSKHFQSLIDGKFKVMTSTNQFCNEMYDYLIDLSNNEELKKAVTK